MAKEFSKSFYNSPAWRKVRKSFIAHRTGIDGGMCQCGCGEPGFIVDHITELTPNNINDTSITLSWSNLQYLALACHNKKTFGSKEENNYYFGEDGYIYQTAPIKNDD